MHKRSSRSQFKNHCPVSLPNVITKLMDSSINMQITNYQEGNSLLAANQFDFRRKMGTADSLTQLHRYLAFSIGCWGQARVLAVDIAGAFDKVVVVVWLYIEWSSKTGLNLMTMVPLIGRETKNI